MPDLTITVERAEAVPFSASPMLALKLHVQNTDPAETIHSVILRSQVQIEVTRRRYTTHEQNRLRDLFGEPERWGQTLRPLLWTNTSTVIPQFTGGTSVDLQIPCSFDFTLGATKYLDGLVNGEIPVCLMFSGTVFYSRAAGALSVAPISWEKETQFRVPLEVWKKLMEAYYPNCAWLCLRKDVFDQLQAFKVELGIPTWEQTLEALLAGLKQAEVVPQ